MEIADIQYAVRILRGDAPVLVNQSGEGMRDGDAPAVGKVHAVLHQIIVGCILIQIEFMSEIAVQEQRILVPSGVLCHLRILRKGSHALGNNIAVADVSAFGIEEERIAGAADHEFCLGRGVC